MEQSPRTQMTRAGGRGRAIAVAVAAMLAAMLAGLLASGQPASAAQALNGLFRLQAGSWSGGVHGSYFRMLQPDGSTYLSNSSSAASDKTYTLLSPGTDGGLRTGSYQPTPNPAFASNGDALSGRVTAPTYFYGVKFATATNQVDPQTGRGTSVPSIVANGSSLSGNLSAFAASWNKQNFNQGSPKPDGSSPGFTRPVTGTYNASTGAFTITWRSLIVGGPFNNFTGEWHLVGTFGTGTVTHTPPPASTHPAGGGAGPVRTSSSAAKAATHAATHKAAPTAKGKHPASSARVVAAGTTSVASGQTGAASASPVNARTAAHHSGGGFPWLIGVVVVVVAAGAAVAYWFVRGRPAPSG